MARSGLLAKMPIQLELKKQIDAICDRFELAWDAAERPRIEQYLELLAGEGRRSLLAELLASELSLRRRQAETCDRSEYVHRFPQDGDLVDDVFNRSPAATARQAETVWQNAASQQYFEIIDAVRSRRGSGGSTTAIHDGEQRLRGLVGRLPQFAARNPAEVDLPLEGKLWLAIFQACRRRSSLDAERADAVIRELLEPFPAARQAILIDVLLGRAGGQADRAGGVTQRTVTSTVLVAVNLLR